MLIVSCLVSHLVMLQSSVNLIGIYMYSIYSSKMYVTGFIRNFTALIDACTIILPCPSLLHAFRAWRCHCWRSLRGRLWLQRRKGVAAARQALRHLRARVQHKVARERHVLWTLGFFILLKDARWMEMMEMIEMMDKTDKKFFFFKWNSLWSCDVPKLLRLWRCMVKDLSRCHPFRAWKRWLKRQQSARARAEAKGWWWILRVMVQPQP